MHLSPWLHPDSLGELTALHTLAELRGDTRRVEGREGVDGKKGRTGGRRGDGGRMNCIYYCP